MVGEYVVKQYTIWINVTVIPAGQVLVRLSYIPMYHTVKSYAFENLIFNVTKHTGIAYCCY
jgi:hypothetical protein